MSKSIHVTLDDEIYDDLAKEAKSEDRYLNQHAARILRLHVLDRLIGDHES